MKIYKITESYTCYVDYVIKANSEEEAMKLYKDNLDNCTEIDNDGFDRYNNDINEYVLSGGSPTECVDLLIALDGRGNLTEF